ncbi:MAG: hypothetical protein H0U76_22845 [Ktedonobacteraceae bacterium]|nr:hypothetical protein [Ktedonobacteraceae bacterium]
MRKARKIVSILLIIGVITVWFFLPSSDLSFPYLYCLGFFLLLSSLFIYPVQAAIARPKTYDPTKQT